MISSPRSLRAALVCAALASSAGFRSSTCVSAAPLELRPGDRISIVGNTLADRMQHHGWLETFLQARFPEHRLTIRNLGFSADTLTVRLRSANFGTPDEWLARMKTTVVFAFFGYNESFAGEAGLPQFRQDLEAFLTATLTQKYDGASPPRVVLFSPIAHEDLAAHDPNLSDGRANNERIKLYAAAMSEVAARFADRGVTFVDLFEPSRSAYAESASPLTINGIHLTADGDHAIAHAAQERLFGEGRFSGSTLDRVRAAVLDKNFHWYQRYRTTDGYSIYGGRADTPKDGLTNRPVMAREMEVLDVMTANRDRRIWDLAAGREVAAQVDDSNAPEFITFPTNRPGPGPGGTYPFHTGEEALKFMTVGRGLKVNLFADETMFPEIVNPVQMAFDPQGRLWIAAWPSYPHWKPKDPMADKLLILEDTDGDGRADVCKTFAGDLHNPTGFEFWNGGVLVANAPELLFLKDTDGDDRYDVREMVLHGLDTADTHHTSNSFTFDPGGAVYFQEGTFHHTQVETPWGPPRRVANGAVFRYEPRAQKFDVYVSHGFANPHGHAFDKWGQDIVVDGTGAVPYHGTLFSGHIEFPAKHDRPPTVYKQRTRPCPGIEYLASRHFPDEFMGNLLVANVIGFQGILRYKVRDEGSSFGAEELEPLISSSDPNFRPTDLETAPDGSLYFVDWQNPIIGHLQHNLRDPNRDKTHGRVYRITCEGRPLPKPATVAGAPLPDLLNLLHEPEDRVRYRARLELSGRKTDDVVAALDAWTAALDKNDAEYEHALLESLWVRQHHNRVDVAALGRVLASPDFRARAAAVRVLVAWRDRVPNALELLRKAAADEAPRVRLEAVRAASFFTEPAAIEVVAIAGEYPRDLYLDYLSKETLKTLDPIWKAELAAGRRIPTVTDAGTRYLLRNMSLEMLLAEKRTRDVAYELLLRPGLRDEQRREALGELARFDSKPEVDLLLDAVRAVDANTENRDASIVFDLIRLLNGRPAAELATIRGALEQLALKAREPVIRQVGYVALMNVDGTVDRAWSLAESKAGALRDLLSGVPLQADAALRSALFERILPLLDSAPARIAKQGLPDGVPGRYVVIELPKRGTLTLAEVEVFSEGRNIAPMGKATQHSTAHGGEARRAVDGNKDGTYGKGGQTHTEENANKPWWELDLGRTVPISSVAIYNRTEGNLGTRLQGYTLRILDDFRKDVVVKTSNPAPKPKSDFAFADEDPTRVVRHAAMNALASMRGREADVFARIAPSVGRAGDRSAAVRALLRLPRNAWPKDSAETLLSTVLEAIRATPSAARTGDDALNLFDFAEGLAALLPAGRARAVRAELGELGVRVVRVGTLLERMSYDQDVYVVRAGKPVEIVFSNDDMMPHNLVVVQPGALEEIGTTSEAQAQVPAFQRAGYVPTSKKVLLASQLLQPRESQKLSFTAPKEPGVYPIVCTYPGHWRRMYASLYVVADLDGYLADPASYLSSNPLAPQDPLLADRRPRTEWKLEDLSEAVAGLTSGRSYGTGKQMFQTAACVACHKLDGVGNEFGPDLTKLDPKWTTLDIVKEMLDPSARINEKFQTFTFETFSGKTVTGLVLAETADAVRIVENPLAKTPPIELKRNEIDSRTKLKTSIMPKGLLDKLSRDEILDLLAYVAARGDKNHPLFRGSSHDHGTPTGKAEGHDGHGH